MIRNLFISYFHEMMDDVPLYVYEALLSVFCIAVTFELAIRGFKYCVRKVGVVLLMEYMFLIFCATVIFRSESIDRAYELTPFWSYTAIHHGVRSLIPETVMNVVMFVPIGLLVGLLYYSISWRKVLAIGLCLSLSIETLQLLFRKGCCETDDVIHNTLGCMIGFGLYRLTRICGNRIVVK